MRYVSEIIFLATKGINAKDRDKMPAQWIRVNLTERDDLLFPIAWREDRCARAARKFTRALQLHFDSLFTSEPFIRGRGERVAPVTKRATVATGPRNGEDRGNFRPGGRKRGGEKGRKGAGKDR